MLSKFDLLSKINIFIHKYVLSVVQIPRKQRIYYLYIHGTGKSTEASMSFRHLEKL